jgi:hypothetical protein
MAVVTEGITSQEVAELLEIMHLPPKQRYDVLSRLHRSGKLRQTRPGVVGGRPPALWDAELAVKTAYELPEDWPFREKPSPADGMPLTVAPPRVSADTAALEQSVLSTGESTGVTASPSDPHVLEVLRQIQMMSAGKRVSTAVYGIWFAVLSMHERGLPITNAGMGEWLHITPSGCAHYLRIMAERGLLIGGRNGAQIQYALNNDDGRALVASFAAAKAKKSATVRVNRTELEQLRDLREQLQGVDLSKLRQVLGGG